MRLDLSNRTPRAVGAAWDVHRGFGDTLALFMTTGVGQNSVDKLMHDVDEEWKNNLRLPQYYHKTVELDKCNLLTPFLNAALIQRRQRNHVIDSRKKYFTTTMQCGKQPA